MTTSDPRPRWRYGLPAAETGAGIPLVCPACGESVAAASPTGWNVTWGPLPSWAHRSDGSPLCPVMTPGGYQASDPISQQELHDTHGCPCDGAHACECACTDCSCRTPERGDIP